MSSTSEYLTDYGSHTRPFYITPGRNCRLYPYIQEPNCTRALYRCKSKALQGLPVNFDYTLAGEQCNQPLDPNVSLGVFNEALYTEQHPNPNERHSELTSGCGLGCGDVREGYAIYRDASNQNNGSYDVSYSTLFPKCTNSVYQGGCRCDQSLRKGYI